MCGVSIPIGIYSQINSLHMKYFYCFLAAIFLAWQPKALTQVFVKADATGANNGSSWADAYTDLQSALDGAAPGQAIWVAAGTYKPQGGTPSTLSVFKITKGVALYGGFAGTETMLSQRNPTVNPTILSGDLNGDDLPNEFNTNRSDNALHVLYVDSLVSGQVLIDGFTIRNGHSLDDNTLPGYMWRGAGLHARHQVEVRNCIFTQHFARTGSSIYLGEGASGSLIIGCQFLQNAATQQSAGVFIDNLSEVEVRKCTFMGNQTNRGALYAYYSADILIDSCSFTNNVNSAGAAAAFFNFNSAGVVLSNSTFKQNVAVNSGAVYYDNTDLAFVSPDNFVVRNCQFIQNSNTGGVGGAFRNVRGSYTLENCLFQQSASTGSGGHIRNDTDGDNVHYKNCIFKDGSSGGWGGAHTCYGVGTFTITNCTYENNVATNLGGAANIGFGAKAVFDSCSFKGNASQNSSGGALSLQNDSTMLIVTNSIFEQNTTTGNGGAIFSGASSSSSFVTVDKCEFWGNEADFGAGIHIGEGGIPEAKLDVSNSIFGFNFASTQGGAINIVDADADIVSSLFINNVADGNGTGGAMSINASDSNHVEVLLLNSTLADNFGVLAGGIAHWTGDLEASSNLFLQNTILRQGGALNYAIEAGTPTASSNGGNMSDDDSMLDILTHPKDLHGADPKFVDPGNFNYQLADDSPAIDAGVDDGAPPFDLLGNPRINEVDMGCYENQNVTAVHEELVPNEGVLLVLPNPVENGLLRFQLNNDWTGRVDFRLYDTANHLLWNHSGQKMQVVQDFAYPVGLEAGIYYLVASNGQQAVVQRVIAF